MTKYLTCKELADRLQLRPATLREYVREGIIPAIRLKPKVLRFDPNRVEEALLARAEQAGAKRSKAVSQS